MNGQRARIAALEKQGWTMRFIAGEPRLGESVEMYRRAGFDVLLEPLPGNRECEGCAGEGTGGECRVCFDGFEEQYRLIFTRPAKADTPSSR